ncbi:MAG: hypothetical protein WCC26_22565 [Terracidiphilus sp.]
MRISNALLVAAALYVPAIAALAQSPAIGARQTSAPAPASQPAIAPAADTAAAPPVPTPLPPPSSLLQGSLDTVRQTLNSVRMERWKRGSVRDEASTDMNSLMTDMQTNLPPLLKDADGGPGSLSKVLPLAKHVNALYDVLLRVVEAARMAAPDDQANALRDALGNLSTARFALEDRMEQAAASQEKQVADLRMTVAKQAAFKCPAPPPPPECPKPAVKKPVHRKPKPPAAATPQGTQQPGATQAKPQASTPQKTPQKPAAQQ